MYVHVIHEDGILMVLLFSVTVPTCLDALAFSDLMIKFKAIEAKSCFSLY